MSFFMKLKKDPHRQGPLVVASDGRLLLLTGLAPTAVRLEATKPTFSLEMGRDCPQAQSLTLATDLLELLLVHLRIGVQVTQALANHLTVLVGERTSAFRPSGL